MSSIQSTTPQAIRHPLTHDDRMALCQCAQNIGTHLSDQHHHFWRTETQWRFQGAWESIPTAWHHEGLLQTDYPFTAHTQEYETFTRPLRILTNQILREYLLGNSLGTRPTDVPHSGLDDYLIQAFYTQWLTYLSDHVLVSDAAMPVPPSDATISFVYIQTLPINPPSLSAPFQKLVITLPLDLAVHLGSQTPPPPKRSWQAFLRWNAQQHLNIMCPARVQAGTTTIPLGDILTLEPGDLIVLEESHTQQLGLMHPQTAVSQPFPIQYATDQLEHISPSTLEAPYHDHDDAKETTPMPYPHTSISADTRDSLWKQLHVDVHAEFKPMRIPIQELRHMSEGLIVEVGDLLDNEIQLVTNGNVIAHGQLVVVGDKFGVLLTQVPGYDKNEALDSLSEPEAPEAPIQRVQSGGASNHQGTHDTEDEVHSTDIDAQLSAYCQEVGLDVALGRQAMVAGFDLESIVNDANAQGEYINDYTVRLLQQNGIDLPEGYEAGIPDGDVDMEELDEELDRTTAMMQEMEDLLDETNE